VDELDAGDLADLGRGLHVDDAGASAGLEAVLVDVGALAESVLGDGEDEAGGDVLALGLELLLAGLAVLFVWGDGEADDVVVLAEGDAFDAVGGASHGADVVLVEADGLALVGGEEDDLAAVGDADSGCGDLVRCGPPVRRWGTRFVVVRSDVDRLS